MNSNLSWRFTLNCFLLNNNVHISTGNSGLLEKQIEHSGENLFIMKTSKYIISNSSSIPCIPIGALRCGLGIPDIIPALADAPLTFLYFGRLALLSSYTKYCKDCLERLHSYLLPSSLYCIHCNFFFFASYCSTYFLKNVNIRIASNCTPTQCWSANQCRLICLCFFFFYEACNISL